MKIAPAQLRTPLVDGKGVIVPIWARWLQEIADSKMREVTTDTEPSMKRGELIVMKTTSTTYLVYYDGEHRYYWESSGSE